MHSYAAHMLWPSAERPDAGQSNKFCMLSERKTAKVFIRYQPHAIHSGFFFNVFAKTQLRKKLKAIFVQKLKVGTAFIQ